MTLTPGTRLGLYEITGAIGAGGMGEVYSARDTKLHRDVAIKVLPELFAADRDRLARFEREAQSLAALNHPNIAQIFGVLEDPPALAMELVEGEDLSERIARGAVPIDETLAIAKQIADALEAAHDRGIIHRDLKPANIKVRDDGTVKVLDFGLAKAVGPVEAGFSRPSDGPAQAGPNQLANSPTFTSPVMTQMGVMLGTAAYMAPEQARGKTVDKRADIWAFGVIVYEMLTGRQLFAGETVSDLLAAVLREDIRLEMLPAGVSPPLHRMLERCLHKDPRRRMRDIGDARLEIEDAIAGRDTGVATVAPGPTARFKLTPWVIAAVVGAALIGVIAGRALTATPPLRSTTTPTVHFDVTPPAGVTEVSNVAMASDATFIVYRGQTRNESALYLHRFDRGTSHMLAGTTGAQWPFLSPDGKWAGFFRAGKLQKISIDGGDALTLCEAGGGPGAVWLPDRRIVFPLGWLNGLSAVSEDGGKPAQLTTPDASRDEKGHWWPTPLPDGRLLFTVFMKGAGLNDNRVALLDPISGKYQTLFPGAKASWLPSGHLLFYRAGRYQIVPFDAAAARAGSGSTAVLDDATDLDPGGDWPQPVAPSPTGAVAYVPGRYAPLARLVWLQPGGAMMPVDIAARRYVDLALSPDGRQAVLGTLEGGSYTMRLADLSRGVDAPLELTGMNWNATWHPDGKHVSFTSMRKGDFDVFTKDVTSSDPEKALISDEMDSSPSVWTPDGKLVYQGSEPDGSYVLKLLDARTSGEPVRLTGRAERIASMSADGKWLAFAATQGGRLEVYVQRFPRQGPAVQVSRDGGESPLFRLGASELYFQRGPQLVAVTWKDDGGRFTTGPERIITTSETGGAALDGPYAVAADGRILILVRAEEPTPLRIKVILGWADELKGK